MDAPTAYGHSMAHLMEAPSARIVAAAQGARVVADADGRRISVRRIGALDKLRLFKAVGPVLAENEPYLGMALLAFSVTEIDDVPVPQPATEAQIENVVQMLGDAGIAALAEMFAEVGAPDHVAMVASAGN